MKTEFRKILTIIVIMLMTMVIFWVTPNVKAAWSSIKSPDTNPFGLAWDDDSSGGPYLWNVDYDDKGAIYKIDPDLSNQDHCEIVSIFDSPSDNPAGLAWDGDYLWCSDDDEGVIYKINPSNGNEMKSIGPGIWLNNPTGLTWDGEHLWCADSGTYGYEGNHCLIYQIDTTNSDETCIELARAPMAGPDGESNLHGLAWDGEHLWVTDSHDKIYEIDPDLSDRYHCEIVNSFLSPGGNQPNGLTWDGEDLWNSDAGTNKIYRLDGFDLTINVNGGGSTDPSSGTHLYNYNEEVTIVATADIDWKFDHWEGDDINGSQNPTVTIIMNDDKEVTACFVQDFAPIAYIDSISPSPADEGETVTFTGHGEDPEGVITQYEWKSNIDGVLSSSDLFQTSSLSMGRHEISFRVKDGTRWSEKVKQNLMIRGGLTYYVDDDYNETNIDGWEEDHFADINNALVQYGYVYSCEGGSITSLTMYVRPGTYEGDIRICQDHIYIHGENPKNTIIDGQGWAAVEILNHNWEDYDSNPTPDVEDIIIEGFTIKSTDTQRHHGIHIGKNEESRGYYAKNIQIYNNIIEIKKGNIGGEPNFGIFVGKYSKDVEIYDNDFIGSAFAKDKGEENINWHHNFWKEHDGDDPFGFEEQNDSNNDRIVDTPYKIGDNQDPTPRWEPNIVSRPSNPEIVKEPARMRGKLKKYNLTVKSIDKDGDQVQFIAIWGNETLSGTDYVNSGEEVEIIIEKPDEPEYDEIRVFVNDEKELWNRGYTPSTTQKSKEKDINLVINRLRFNHPLMFELITRLVQRISTF